MNTKRKKIYIGIECKESLFLFEKCNKYRIACVEMIRSDYFYYIRLFFNLTFIVLLSLKTY
jgi:hypothetical protein